MAQDYSRTRRSSNRRKSNEPRVPAWVWLFTGCVLGAFIMFLMRLSQLDPVQRIADSKTTSSSSAKVTKKESKPAQPKFDFYEVLKETRVSIPELTDKDNTVSSDEPPAQTDTYEYILQVASFKNVDDAEELRVQLLLLNLDARVERAEVRKGDTWNRVLVGPFESRSLLAKARGTLVSNHHEALVLKRMKTPAP